MSTPIRTSLFDLFRIGPGPSSSHTIGAMRIGHHFLQVARALPSPLKQRAARVRITLFGSLSATGLGHATERAVLAGLLGNEPATCPPGLLDTLLREGELPHRMELLPGNIPLFRSDVQFDRERLDPPHSNTMVISLLDGQGGPLLEQEYYSTGGGEIRWAGAEQDDASRRGEPVHHYSTMRELRQCLEAKRLRLVDLMIDNEVAITGVREEDVFERIDQLYLVMEDAVRRGLKTEGVLPGPLQCHRKAPGIFRRAQRLGDRADQWLLHLCAYAFAVAEENAAGQPVVTAPTCGSAGVLAATYYFLKHFLGKERAALQDALLAAAAVGFLSKHNASISGAEVGCQGEVGVASSMAAAFLSLANTADVRVVENAAQTALEHHLGMTCDPVCGYVQIPCIERNAMGAVKAYTAYLIASTEVSRFHRVDLDETILAMVQTGRDIPVAYRETARGGLARTVLPIDRLTTD